MSVVEALYPLIFWLFVGGIQVLFVILTACASYVREVVFGIVGGREEGWLFIAALCQFFAALFSILLTAVVAEWIGLRASITLLAYTAGLNLFVVWKWYDEARWEERMEEIAAKYPGEDEEIFVEEYGLLRWLSWAMLISTVAGLALGIYLHWDLPAM